VRKSQEKNYTTVNSIQIQELNMSISKVYEQNTETLNGSDVNSCWEKLCSSSKEYLTNCVEKGKQWMEKNGNNITWASFLGVALSSGLVGAGASATASIALPAAAGVIAFKYFKDKKVMENHELLINSENMRMVEKIREAVPARDFSGVNVSRRSIDISKANSAFLHS